MPVMRRAAKLVPPIGILLEPGALNSNDSEALTSRCLFHNPALQVQNFFGLDPLNFGSWVPPDFGSWVPPAGRVLTRPRRSPEWLTDVDVQAQMLISRGT